MTSTDCRLKPGRKKKINDDDVCMVCNGKSVGMNVGVHTCSPCKAFFRRNAVKLGVCLRDRDLQFELSFIFVCRQDI